MRPGLTFLILLLVSSSKAEQYLLDTVTGWKAKCSGEKKKKNCPVTPQKNELTPTNSPSHDENHFQAYKVIVSVFFCSQQG